MSASAPWSVKGIDAKAREVAKDLARRSGMTLGEWLNQMILEGEDVGAAINREREARNEPAPEPLLRRRPPVYRETQNDMSDAQPVRRPAPFSSAARPLAARETTRETYREPVRDDLRTGELRRRSIFEDRPRYDEDEEYGATSGELGRVARALESLSARIEGSESRSATAVRGVSSAVDTILGRLERSEAAQAEVADRFVEEAQDLRASVERHEESREAIAGRLEQAERLIDAQAERLEGLSSNLREERDHVARLEAQLKSPQAQETIRAVEGALGKLANQLYEGEQRSRDTVTGIREDMVGLSHRVAQMEVRDPERIAQTAIDKVVTRLAQRLEQAEAQTSGAIKALEQAFTTLDARLGRAEERGDVTDPEQVASLSRLANDLSRRVEDSRHELLNALDSRTYATAEQLLKTLGERIDHSEKRQAAAIEKLGADVMRVAETLGRRVAASEAVNHDGLSRLGGEVHRIAESVETRFARNDATHGQALERLSSEIARISGHLTTRLADSERRTAHAVEGVGQVLEQHRDQSRSEFSDRIRQSEERTAKMLEEARNRLDQKMAQVQKQALLSESLQAQTVAPRPAVAARPAPVDLPNPFAVPVQPAAVQPAPQVAVAPQPAPQPVFQAEPVTDLDPVSDMANGFDDDDDDIAVAAEVETKTVIEEAPKSAAPAPQGTYIAGPAFAADDSFSPEFDPFADEDLEYDLEPAAEHRSETPRAAAFARPRAMRDVEDEGTDDLSGDEDDLAPASARQSARDIDLLDDEPTGVSVSTRDALAAARAAVRASMEAGNEDRLGGLGLKAGASRSRGVAPKAKRGGAPDNTVMQALKASAIAGAVAIVGIGSVVAYNQYGKDATSPTETTPLAATAVVTPDKPDQALLHAEFLSASQAVDARAPGAVGKLAHVAEQGYPQAQHMLSGIYRGDGNLVKPDDQAARTWTQRAAEGGVAAAMYNLGTMYYNGVGGPKNPVTAAMWFRKAATYGISDSQYNLGLLFERGDGVPINPSEAYKWLSIAAKSGDKDAAREAAAIRQDLSDAQRQKAEDAIAAFKPVDDGMGDTATSPKS